MSDSVFTHLANLCVKRYKVELETIKPEGDIFETLGIDSFQAAELMSEVEMQFDVEIPDYELQDIKTFGALAGAIEART